MRRRCLEAGCREWTSASRCTAHAAEYAARHVNPLYAGDWRRRSREQRERMPWCADCGATVDLTADHLDPGNPESELTTRCRQHNSSLSHLRGRRVR